MKVLGIIAEYNPFHNGHLYHLQESKRMLNPDYTVCVMSGDFTQRGEPAMADKWLRASMAAANGIDLVLELPFAFASNNAEFFAAGAVDLLDRLGCVTHLSFGSESGDLAVLKKTAAFLTCETEELKAGIKEFSDQGISFPKARYEAVKRCIGEKGAEVLKNSNNILAVEYLKQLKLRNSAMEPITVTRYGTGYHDKETFEEIASATAVRHILRQSEEIHAVSKFIPERSLGVLQSSTLPINPGFSLFYPLLIYRILTTESAVLGSVLSATEGLENKLKKAAVQSKDLESFLSGVLSKRYTSTRIHRLLTHTVVHLDKQSFEKIISDKINYARVLAFNKKGAALIKRIKKEEQNTIPILTNINRELNKAAKEWQLLKFDILASDIYHLAVCGETYSRSDYVMKPYHHLP
jgi:predicted nucleotidyltransferase